MPRHRSLNLKKFIEAIPDPLIEEYFNQKIEDGESLPLKTFDYESVNTFLDTIQNEELRGNILEQFTHINDICERNMNILVKAMHYYNIEIDDEKERQELAMDIFLHHKRAYERAYDYYCLYNSSSKMSSYNMQAEDFALTTERIEEFRARVGEFYSDLAKGSECHIRHYDEEEEAVIVVIHGSYRRSVMVWDNQETRTIFFRPANEDILRFNKAASTLSLKAPYQRDKDNYIKAFAETILEDKTQAERTDRDKTYTLKPLQNGAFSFAGNEVITSITLVEVKMVMRGFTEPTITIKSPDVITTLEDDLSDISLNSGDLVHAKFKFRIEVEGKGRDVTFEITPPNATDLTKKRYADIISDYLRENGVKLV